MGHNPGKETPFFFQKNPNNLDFSGIFPYPSQSKNVQYEAELAVMLKSGGVNIKLADAVHHVYGYALSMDVTRHDLQGAQKKLGLPWEIRKSFEDQRPLDQSIQ